MMSITYSGYVPLVAAVTKGCSTNTIIRTGIPCGSCRPGSTIGIAAQGHDALSEQQLQELLRLALAPILAGKEEVNSHKNLIGGAVRAVADDGKREALFKSVTASLSEEETVQLFILAPFGKWVFRPIVTADSGLS
jgi:hypothetical protein